MKSRLSAIVMSLLLITLIGIIALVVRDATRSPENMVELAHDKMKEKDFVSGARYMIRAADAGFAPAQYELGLMYDTGDKIPENRDKAIFYMTKALEAGLSDASYVMGVWTERGYFGAPDTQKAIQYYETAAKAGHKNAMTSLVVLYDTVNPDRQQFWYNTLITKEKMK